MISNGAQKGTPRATLPLASADCNRFLRLLRVLAGSSQNDLRRQIQYLKAEKEILRARIDGQIPHCAPNLNAHVERFIQTVQTKCLDRFIVMGTSHLDYLMGEYIKHHNKERPHSAIHHCPPAGQPTPLRLTAPGGSVRCRSRLGGVLRHYYRVAA